MASENMHFATMAIHGGISLKDPNRPLATPIYQNATYAFDSCEQGGRRFALEEPGYIYSRVGNPTTTVLETRLAELEGAEAGLSFSSGMGAMTSVVYTFCKAGDHIVIDTTLYGCTFAYFTHGLSKFGVDVTVVDFADLAALQNALKKETVMVFFETPSNPNMKILDIQAIADIAHGYNKDIKVVIDNTFCTPYLQQPIALGCDLVVHSATKYLNGHGDVIAGFACGTAELITQVRLFGLKDMTGAVQSGMDSFLVLRGLKTLELRMERHCDNAERIVEYLKQNPKVDKIYYPGLADHPNHEIAKRQMKRFGGMIAFEVKGGMQAGKDLLDNLNICTLAVSLGDAETLVQHPASMTHSAYTAEDRAIAKISDGLIRISCGLENVEDLIADLEQSFTRLK